MTEDLEERLTDLEARVDALNRARMTMFDRLDEIEEKVDTLMQTVQPDPNHTSYEEMTRQQKVHKIRTHLLEQAVDTNGVGALKFGEVKALFDGHPSTGHVYDLMEYAGELDGYEYQTDPTHRVVVEAHDVNDNALVHIVNSRDTANHA